MRPWPGVTAASATSSDWCGFTTVTSRAASLRAAQLGTHQQGDSHFQVGESIYLTLKRLLFYQLAFLGLNCVKMKTVLEGRMRCQQCSNSWIYNIYLILAIAESKSKLILLLF